MQPTKILFNLILYLAALFTMQACRLSYPEYGKIIFPLINDSLQTSKVKIRLNQLIDTGYQPGQFLLRSGRVLPFRLLKPLNLTNKDKYPLVITFHNSSRIGTDNQKQLEPLARIWLDTKIRKKYLAFVVAPQFSARSSTYMANSNGQMTAQAQPDLLAIFDLIDSIIKAYPIDERRIYLVGYSMGGSSVLGLLSHLPSRFAAAVAIAAVPQINNIEALSTVPIWLIHGTNDTDNPFAGSERLFPLINTHHQTRYWIYEERTHHNIVSAGLLGDRIPHWLFSKRK